MENSSSDPSADVGTIVRSNIWYSDGSIVLQAQSTQSRVHKSVLAMHSTVFDDLFNSGLPADGDTLEGCPVVLLYDTAEDVAHLLRTLYTPSKHFDTGNALALAVVSAVLRLGNKYNVQHFYEKAAACVTAEYPTTLKEFDESTEWRTLQDYPGISVDVIRVARDINLLCVLPQAYRFAFETRAHPADALSSPENPIAHFDNLATGDQLLCVDGHAKTCAASTELLSEWVDQRKDSETCTKPQKCYLTALELFHGCQKSCAFDIITETWDDDLATGFCSSCEDNLKTSYQDWRQDVWDRLPSFYGMPSWEELKTKSDVSL